MANKECLYILSIFKLLISIGSLVILILNFVYLFKIINNCKKEPTNYQSYVNEEQLDLYSNKDFCSQKVNLYYEKGAFETFDLRIKKIKIFSRGLVSTTFISIFLSILGFLIIILFQIRSSKKEDIIAVLSIIYLIFTFINFILSIVFFILLCVHYFKSDFGDFESFSHCEFLKEEFNNDYKFVFNVKDNFKIYLILWIVSICVNLIENLLKCISKIIK